MTLEVTASCPAGWRWIGTDDGRIELGRTDGPTLLAEGLESGGWRVLYRAERGPSTVVDALGTVEATHPPRNLLERAAWCIERLDAPEATVGELLTIENGTVNCREWRIEWARRCSPAGRR